MRSMNIVNVYSLLVSIHRINCTSTYTMPGYYRNRELTIYLTTDSGMCTGSEAMKGRW
jgi:hypothetical protein